MVRPSRFACRLAVTTGLMLGAAPVFAADLAAPSLIDAVSVYPDGATVTRIIDFSAPAGETTLVCDDLPEGLDPASIRVDARDADGIAISGIDLAGKLTETPAPDEQVEKSLRELRDKRESLAGVQRALQGKQSLIARIAATATFDASKDGASVNAIRGTWNAIGEDLADVNDKLRANAVEIRDVDEEIARLEARHDGRPQGKRRTELRLSFSSERPAKGRLAVSYLIGNAGWTPLYDARLDNGTGTLEITRRARIAQQTGEDWTNVALTVSTAHASAGATVPRLESTLLNFQAIEPPLAKMGGLPPVMAAPRARMEANADQAAAAPPAPAPPRPGMEVSATLNTGGFQSTWSLPQRATILSSNATRSLRLAATTLTPQIRARSAPALQQTAYLEASFDNPDQTPFFPGIVSIYRDGLYAGQADMPLATTGEPVQLGFGADDRIKVERVVTRKIETNTGQVRPITSEQRSFRINLRNGRPTPITLFIEEALPVAENRDIKVETLPQTTPPTGKDADGRRGVQVWAVDLPAGATKAINFGYRVTWPGDELINLD